MLACVCSSAALLFAYDRIISSLPLLLFFIHFHQELLFLLLWSIDRSLARSPPSHFLFLIILFTDPQSTVLVKCERTPGHGTVRGPWDCGIPRNLQGSDCYSTGRDSTRSHMRNLLLRGQTPSLFRHVATTSMNARSYGHSYYVLTVFISNIQLSILGPQSHCSYMQFVVCSSSLPCSIIFFLLHTLPRPVFYQSTVQCCTVQYWVLGTTPSPSHCWIFSSNGWQVATFDAPKHFHSASTTFCLITTLCCMLASRPICRLNPTSMPVSLHSSTVYTLTYSTSLFALPLYCTVQYLLEWCKCVVYLSFFLALPCFPFSLLCSVLHFPTKCFRSLP